MLLWVQFPVGAGSSHTKVLKNGLILGADPGADPGGGVLGLRIPPFWKTPKLHKEGKNVACV